MAIDPKSLTIDYKTLMNNTSISERVGLTKSSAGQQLLSSLSPTDLASAFPDYYKKNNPDVSGFIEATSRRYGKGKDKTPGTEFAQPAEPGSKTGPSNLGRQREGGRTGGPIDRKDPVIQKLEEMGFKMPADVGAKDITQRGNALLTLIQSKESMPREDYSTYDVTYGNYGGKSAQFITPEQMFNGKKLSELNIDQVINYQQSLRSQTRAAGIGGGLGTSAVGRGQFLEGTLKQALTYAGVNAKDYGNTKFTPELQDKLMLLTAIHKRNLDPDKIEQWINDPKAIKGLGLEWEGLSVEKGKISQSQLMRELKNIAALPAGKPLYEKPTVENIQEKTSKLADGLPKPIVEYYNKLPEYRKETFAQAMNQHVEKNFNGNVNKFNEKYDTTKSVVSDVDAIANRNRPGHITGTLSLPQVTDPKTGEKVNSPSFEVGSGGAGRGSIPFGIHELSGLRNSGPVVSSAYGRQKVVEVGSSASNYQIINDPKQGYRSEIQIHSTSDIKRLISMGCIVIPKDRHDEFVASYDRALKEHGKLYLQVTPSDKGQPHQFRVLTQADYDQLNTKNTITTQQAVNNFDKTGHVDPKNTPATEAQSQQPAAPVEPVKTPGTMTDAAAKVAPFAPGSQQPEQQQYQLNMPQLRKEAREKYGFLAPSDDKELDKKIHDTFFEKYGIKPDVRGRVQATPEKYNELSSKFKTDFPGKNADDYITRIVQQSAIEPQPESAIEQQPEAAKPAAAVAAYGDEQTTSDQSNIKAFPIKDDLKSGNENTALVDMTPGKEPQMVTAMNSNESITSEPDKNKFGVTPEFKNRPDQLKSKEDDKTQKEAIQNFENTQERIQQTANNPPYSPMNIASQINDVVPTDHVLNSTMGRYVARTNFSEQGQHHSYGAANYKSNYG